MSKQRFHPSREHLYLAFYKPYGVLSQFSTDEVSLKRTLAEFGFPKDVYPIGRLDWDSEGLLLLSNDGRLNQALLHPAGAHERIYLAQVENIPSRQALEHLRQGVLIQGQMSLPAQASLLQIEPDLPERPVPIRFRQNIPTAWLSLTLTEGRNRQVRRLTAAVGHPTLRLVRVAIGALALKDLALQPGEWQPLTQRQILSALSASGSAQKPMSPRISPPPIGEP